jgi:16S rRNA processing protein RimM
VTTNTQSNQDERFKVGQIVGFHALDGGLKIRPGTNNVALLEDIETVTLVLPKIAPQLCHINSLRVEKGNLIVWFDEYTDRTSTEKLIGAEVWTDRDQLNELQQDEWWIKDLIGLDVYTTEGEHVGTVFDVITGSNELLEIKKLGGTESDTALVPFVEALVPVVDIPNRRVEIKAIPGLLD